jgi:hypothetical protein
MIWVWDEIINESKPLSAEHPLDCNIEERKDGTGGWQMDSVADFPDGVRIVVEKDERMHTAIIMTKL